MALIPNYNYHFSLFENSALPACYEIAGKENIGAIPPGKGLAIVHLVPPYLDQELKIVRTEVRVKHCFLHSGYFMDLSASDSADGFFRQTLGGRTYKNLRRIRRRLEESADVRLETWYGKIDSETYNGLMASFKSMIAARFNQKGMQHDALKRWDLYLENSYRLIREERASLMVLYDGTRPIAIGFNYHFRDILVSAITSYDVGYERFGLGIQMMMERVRWCYDNSYRLVDLGWGDLEYKSKLANRIEPYRTDIVYPSDKPFLAPLALLLAAYLKLKKQLRTKNSR